MFNQDQTNELKSIWQAVRWRMNERRVTPAELSPQTGYSKKDIERGIGGEPVPVTEDFLQRCVLAFNLKSARAKFFEEPPDILPYAELVKLIKPTPAMPPRQGNFWDYL